MIVHDYDIEREITFLGKCTHDGIPYCAGPVIYRYYHRCHNREISLLIYLFINGFHIHKIRIFHRWTYPCPHPFQMFSTYLLHLNLDLAVLRVHIIELSYPAGAFVNDVLGI